jgi:hypothetical protein
MMKNIVSYLSRGSKMTHLILSRLKKMNRAYWSTVGLLLALMLLTAWIGLHTFAYLNL